MWSRAAWCDGEVNTGGDDCGFCCGTKSILAQQPVLLLFFLANSPGALVFSFRVARTSKWVAGLHARAIIHLYRPSPPPPAPSVRILSCMPARHWLLIPTTTPLRTSCTEKESLTPRIHPIVICIDPTSRRVHTQLPQVPLTCLVPLYQE